MNQFRRLMTDSRFHTLIAIAALGYVVWTYGPQFHFGQQTPFESISNRLIALVALAFIWGLTNIREELNPFKRLNMFHVQSEIQIISNKLKAVQKQIKRAQKKGATQRAHIHWHLVLGPRNSGKTHLLNCALENDQDYALITATQDCAIWHTLDNVFIELGERFLPHHDDTDSCKLLFQAFIKLCERLDIQFHNVVVATPINQVMTNTVDVDVTRTQQMLTTLIAQNPGLPISVIFTKCDQMAGFTAFFCDLTMDERNQYCGIRLPLGQTANALKKTINKHLQQLNKRFHDRLLTRLQQETNSTLRTTMHDFPYQFEIFCSRSIHFLNELLPNCDLNITGLFFTSSQQSGPSTNHLTAHLADVFSLQRQPQFDMYTQQTPYFITELCQHLLPSFAENATHFIHPRKKMNPLFVPILVISFLGLGIYHLYNTDIEHLQLAHNTIKNAQLANNKSIIQIAQNLAALDSGIKLINDKHSSGIGHYIRPGHPRKLTHQAKNQYDNILKTDFANALDQTLKLKLQQLSQASNNGHLADLYDTLKLTLLLKQPDPLSNSPRPAPDKQALNHQIYDWYATHWQSTITDNNTRQLLLSALSNTLQNTNLTLPSDPILIENARLALSTSSPDNIVYTVLENQNRKAPLIFTDNSLSEHPIQIPSIYTHTAFKRLFHQEIPALCEKFAEGDWVLGNDNIQNTSNGGTQLIQAVQNRYLNNYLTAWQNALAKLHYTPRQKYGQMITVINNLSSTQSPIVDFVQTVQANTSKMEGEEQFNDSVGDHFTDINDLSMDVAEDPTHIALVNFSKYFRPIAQSDDPSGLAFNITKKRMSKPDENDAINQLINVAEETPEPIKSYLTALANNGWQLLINDSREHINRVWAQIVLPEYQQHLHNRYPLFIQANAEISLDEFAHFFAPNGIVDTFFKHYVQDFITNSDSSWQWKTINGQQLALSDDALATFIRAKLIQQMFFAQGNHHPTANFALTPTSLHSELKNFTLILNGQRIDYHGPQQPPEPITWPGPHQNGVFIEVADNADQKSQIAYPGLWGIFHLLDQAQVIKTSSDGLELSWIINEKRIDCHISADGPINPFTPGIINQFRCPQSLI